jgi:hypothetical protein
MLALADPDSAAVNPALTAIRHPVDIRVPSTARNGVLYQPRHGSSLAVPVAPVVFLRDPGRIGGGEPSALLGEPAGGQRQARSATLQLVQQARGHPPATMVSVDLEVVDLDAVDVMLVFNLPEQLPLRVGAKPVAASTAAATSEH